MHFLVPLLLPLASAASIIEPRSAPPDKASSNTSPAPDLSTYNITPVPSLINNIFGANTFQTAPSESGENRYSANFTSSYSNGTYAPEKGNCPTGITWIRDARSQGSTNGTIGGGGGGGNETMTRISDEEAEYMRGRQVLTNAALKEWITKNKLLPDSQINAIFPSSNNTSSNSSGSYIPGPRTAIAFSGGGYRSMLNGAGIYQALDNRTGTEAAGKDGDPLAGLLQGMDYIAGTSGGAWLVASSIVKDFAPLTGEGGMNETWSLNKNLLTGNKGNEVSSLRRLEESVSFFVGIRDLVKDKEDEGFNTTLTDYWGLALGRQLFNHRNGAPNALLSNITLNESFQNHTMPFPILLADGHRANETIVSKNSTLYEFNPFEFGSWDNNQTFFFPTRYLGTNMTSGKPTDSKKCVTRFDSMPFITGTTSNFFNRALAEQVQHANTSQVGSKLSGIEGLASDRVDKLKRAILSDITPDSPTLAPIPNPFHHHLPTRNPTAPSPTLSLVDGATDSQSLPLLPLLLPARALDFILAIDSSSDTATNWPNGTSLLSTSHRLSQNTTSSSIPFPPLPASPSQFITQGLTRRPTFFGCDAAAGPIIAYVPNTPISYFSNFSTLAPNYTYAEVEGMYGNGRAQILTPLEPESAKMGSGGKEGKPKLVKGTDWARCLACAVVERERERQGGVRGRECQACLDTWCWKGGNGTTGGEEGGKDGGGDVKFEPGLGNGSSKGYESVVGRKAGEDMWGFFGRITGYGKA